MKALLLVDIQHDFLPNGNLAVPNGDQVIPIANKLIPHFDHVIATKDWHPSHHKSFASNNNKSIGDIIDLNGLEQFMWPDHCIQDTFGSEFPEQLNTDAIKKIIYKGTDPEIDSYSGFFDNGHKKSTELHAYLQSLGIKELYVMGLATDYCVKFTALDAQNLGYITYLIEDGCQGVEITSGDIAKAIETMKDAGIQMIKSQDLISL